ncbi:unnamed protein product [Durusdinium trenchii]|uniref:Serine aminopeptidase S33 domain-containing protein n=1 Tax=Durusdinium trenchii TaxID=1381693 RepID=A0ABP0L073_9DINO
MPGPVPWCQIVPNQFIVPLPTHSCLLGLAGAASKRQIFEAMGSAESGVAPSDQMTSQTIRACDGTLLPSKRLAGAKDLQSDASTLFVFLHGLGERMSHYDETSANVNLQKASIAHSALSIVLFDARGHGASSGWEGGGPDQFHWRCLGSDMLQVALAHTAALVKPWAPSYILGGCSMGAAAAVWAALLSPRCVRGLVLYMVPTMWAGRKTRRGALEARANAVRQTDPVRADVMLGVLIVTARDDPIHPASSAEMLGEIFGSNARVISNCQAAEAASMFTLELERWLQTLDLKSA